MSYKSQRAQERFQHYHDLQVWLAFSYGVQIGRQQMLAELRLLVEKTAIATGGGTGAIAVVENGQLRTLVSYGELVDQLPEVTPLDDSLISYCVRTGIPQMRLQPLPEQSFSEIRSLIYQPLIFEGRTAGVLAIFSSRSQAFTDHEFRLSETHASIIGAALGWQRYPEIFPPAQEQEDADQELLVGSVAGSLLLSPAPVQLPESAVGSLLIETDKRKVNRLAWSVVGVLILFAILLALGVWQLRSWNVSRTLRSSTPSATVNKVESQSVLPNALVRPGTIQMSDFALRNEKEHDFVVFRFSGPTEYRVQKLTSPDRIVLDFPVAVAEPATLDSSATGRNVSHVRVGFDESHGTRAVLDLKSKAEFLVVQPSDQSRVVLDVFPSK